MPSDLGDARRAVGSQSGETGSRSTTWPGPATGGGAGTGNTEDYLGVMGANLKALQRGQRCS
jgi:hypothetical protein